MSYNHQLNGSQAGPQIIVVQAAELMQARKIIPDLATWTQCFASCWASQP